MDSDTEALPNNQVAGTSTIFQEETIPYYLYAYI